MLAASTQNYLGTTYFKGERSSCEADCYSPGDEIIGYVCKQNAYYSA